LAKLPLSDILGQYASVTELNNNFSLIEEALENTISRDGTSPNTMSGTLDMNSQRITNLPAPVANTDPLRKIDVPTSDIGVSTALNTSLTDTNTRYVSSNVEGAFAELTVPVAGITALKGIAPVANDQVYLEYHTTVADLGHGFFRGVTGAAPGTYVDNNGTIIVPTAGDGSAAWLRVNENVVTTKQFGAKGDGSTDDTVAIEAADLYTSANNLTLYFNPGTYIASDLTLNTDSSWTCIRNKVIIQRKTGSTGHFITGSSINSVNIENIKIDGNKSAISGTYFNLFFTGCYDVQVYKVSSINSPAIGIDIREGIDVVNDTWSSVSNCTVTDNTTIGISHNNQSRITISRNVILNNGSHGINGGGTVQDNDVDIEVEHNRIEGNTGYGINENFIGADFDITTGRKSPMKDLSVIGNTLRNNATGGALIQANGYIFSNNKCLSNGTTTAHPGVVCNGDDGTVTGNRCINNTGIGIDMGLADTATVSANLCKLNGASGIVMEASTGINVTGNTVQDNSQSGVGTFSGIKVEGGNTTFEGDTTDISVVGNHIMDGTQQQYAILCRDNNGTGAYTCNDVLITGNHSDNAGTATADYHIEISTCRYYNNFTAVGQMTIASGATLTIYEGHDVYNITGTTNIDTINTDGGGLFDGRLIEFRFSDILTVGDGTGNCNLAGGFTTSASDTLMLRWVAATANWEERGRSAN